MQYLYTALDAITTAGNSSLMNILCIYLFSWLIMAIHELGHALAFKLCSTEIKSISLGIGLSVWFDKVQLGIIPLGFTRPLNYDNLEHSNIGNLKLLLMVLGGVLIQGLLALVLAPFIDNSIVACAFYLNILFIAINLIPIPFKSMINDGMKAVMLLTYIARNKYALED